MRNIGAAGAPAGLSGTFDAGDPEAGGTLLGADVTPAALLPGQIVQVALPLPGSPDAMVHVVVDEAPMHGWQECHTTNNRASGSAACEP